MALMNVHQNNNGNGNGVTWRWMVGVLLSAFVVIGGWAWSQTAQRVLELEQVNYNRGERIATLESTDRARKEQLDRIEAKVDSLLTRTGR